jgi:hypothetical protein
MLKTGRLDRRYNGIIDCFSRTARVSRFLAFDPIAQQLSNL